MCAHMEGVANPRAYAVAFAINQAVASCFDNRLVEVGSCAGAVAAALPLTSECQATPPRLAPAFSELPWSRPAWLPPSG